MMNEKERYYSLSMLRALAYDDDVNGNCDGKIDFTVIDSISGADVASRSDVAREIFEEIEDALDGNYNGDYNADYPIPYYMEELKNDITKLKKKYTGES